MQRIGILAIRRHTFHSPTCRQYFILHSLSFAPDMSHSTVWKISRYHDSRLELRVRATMVLQSFSLASSFFIFLPKDVEKLLYRIEPKKNFSLLEIRYIKIVEDCRDWNSETQTTNSLSRLAISSPRLWLLFSSRSERKCCGTFEKSPRGWKFCNLYRRKFKALSPEFSSSTEKQEILRENLILNEKSEIECNNFRWLRGWLHKSRMLAKLRRKETRNTGEACLSF